MPPYSTQNGTATSAIGTPESPDDRPTRDGRSSHIDFASTDYNTDNVIQESLRNELNKDVTLLIIAHRLQTIMDVDKIVSLVHLLRNRY